MTRLDGDAQHIDCVLLNEFADGELTGASFEAVRSHLSWCAACREQVSFIRLLGAAIRSFPTPRPPAQLFQHIFPEEPRDTEVLPLPVQRASPRSGVRSARSVPLVALGLSLIGAAVGIAVTSDRVMAGTSNLILELDNAGSLKLQYETVSALAAESSLRVRVRYWIPDSLRLTQTEPRYTGIELTRADVGMFKGVANLPPGTAYAVAAVEDREATRVDTNRGGLWEYLETDRQGRPTARARLHQMLSTQELRRSRFADVVERGIAEFPERAEFWAALLRIQQRTMLGGSNDTLSQTHLERLDLLDRAAREGDPKPSEMYALGVYSRLLGRRDIEAYWQSELTLRHPRHEYASQARLWKILPSSLSDHAKMDALEQSWRLAPMPATAQAGLQLSYRFSDPALTRIWLDRYDSEPVLRDLRFDVETARRIAEVPTLRTVAEEWIVEQLQAPQRLAWSRPAPQRDAIQLRNGTCREPGPLESPARPSAPRA